MVKDTNGRDIVKRIIIFLTCASLIGLSGCAYHRKRTANDLVAYGVDLARKGYWKEAVTHWRLVLKSNPDNIAVLNNLAVAAESENDQERAKQLFIRALQIDPGSSTVKKNYEAFNTHLKEEKTLPEPKKEKKKWFQKEHE
jgi:Flp pilus assembly protein TadD